MWTVGFGFIVSVQFNLSISPRTQNSTNNDALLDPQLIPLNKTFLSPFTVSSTHVPVAFPADEVALGEAVFLVRRFFPVAIIPRHT
jgi:hypothetical protein